MGAGKNKCRGWGPVPVEPYSSSNSERTVSPPGQDKMRVPFWALHFKEDVAQCSGPRGRH